jgi:hypothetical protein
VFDTLLFLHVLAAFAIVATVVVYSAFALGWTADSRLLIVGRVMWAIGGLGTLVFGVWLAFYVQGYEIYDGWIIAALVLWAVSGALGQRTGVAYMRGMTKAKELDGAGQTGPNAELSALNRTTGGVVLHALVSAAALLLVLDMVFKPGA